MSRFSRVALAVLGALAALWLAPVDDARAQISNRSMTAPHPFGVMLGDVFTLRTRLDVAAPFKLDQSALPKPGPVTYWLDLRDVSVTEKAAPNGGTRYEIAAEYQTFYAPMEAIEQTVPALKLVATDGKGGRTEADGATWSFVTSPMRPLVATAGGGSAYQLRGDESPERPSLRRAETVAAAAGGASLVALLLLAWSRAWPPFHKRPSRPFAKAARVVARQAKAGEQGWREAALSLHRAFDAAAGRRLLGDDLGGFLATRPAFRRLEADIASFFSASRLMFFGETKGSAALPATSLTQLSRDLAAAERSS